MKKLLSLVLCLCLLATLCAGCSKPASTTENAAASTEPTINAAKEALDGKKILFIGNSQTYVGKVVNQVYNAKPALSARQNDKGQFYLICQKNGIEVSITNWTFSSHRLDCIFRNPCAIEGDCFGKNHEEYLTDRYYDYVVIQPGNGTQSESTLAEDIAYIVDFFKKENPNVKFALLGNASVYGNNATNTPYPGIPAYYKTLAEQGFIMADWGKLVNDLIKNEVTPEGSNLPYEKSSFIIKDGFHPNMLSGYIASMMLFCAITGENAVDLPADLFQNVAMSTLLDEQLKNSYDRGEMDTNFKTVLTVESELKSIHKLIDQYLDEKPYMQY